MHEEGFRKALTNAVNKYAKARGLLKEKDENLTGEDIREGLTAIISVRLQDPQFEGQTKAKLGNVSIRSLVERATNDPPGRVAGAEPHRDPPDRPEGPAGGPGQGGGPPGPRPHPAQVGSRGRRAARQAGRLLQQGPARIRAVHRGGQLGRWLGQGGARPRIQAILPIRGKILNVERVRIDRMLKNTEVQALISAIGAGVGDEFDVAKVRYNKIVALCDADVDGSHIRTLLLTFFFRQMRDLVEQGHVYIAQPPLYSTTVSNEKVYIRDEGARVRFIEDNPNRKLEFARFKGLGEMDATEFVGDHHGPQHAQPGAGERGAGRHRRRGVLHPHGRRRG